MRCFVALVSLVLLPALASAEEARFNGRQAVEQYYELRGTCRMAETPDGRQLTEQEWDRVCELRDELGKQIRDHGYCWDSSEVEWYVCEPQAS
jgi:DNA-binding IclR family transcriptional regulator